MGWVPGLFWGFCGIVACVLHYPFCPQPPTTHWPTPFGTKWRMNRYMFCCPFCSVCHPISPFSACLWTGCRNPTSRQVKYTARTDSHTHAHTHTHTVRLLEKSVTKMVGKTGGKWADIRGGDSSRAIRLGNRRIQTNNNHATIVRAANKLLFYVYTGVQGAQCTGEK